MIVVVVVVGGGVDHRAQRQAEGQSSNEPSQHACPLMLLLDCVEKQVLRAGLLRCLLCLSTHL